LLVNVVFIVVIVVVVVVVEVVVEVVVVVGKWMCKSVVFISALAA